MPQIEVKKEMKATAKTIYDILDDTMNMANWNLVVREVEELEPDKKYFLKTNVGDITATRTESVPNEKISTSQVGSPMTEMGYILKAKGETTEVTIWGKFDDPGQEQMLMIAGDVFLKSLKKYSEYIEAGGDPKEFKKK
ncbi:MAG: SRPBCC family protein [Candidatus Hodarchaeota archaeon]